MVLELIFDGKFLFMENHIAFTDLCQSPWNIWDKLESMDLKAGVVTWIWQIEVGCLI